MVRRARRIVRKRMKIKRRSQSAQSLSQSKFRQRIIPKKKNTGGVTDDFNAEWDWGGE